ncbi:MAG TPA: flagellar filament capping protein FliD [Caldimonas sp.]|nr:flagellar filament capping protein FliD [Caldimonas sp.]HEV7578634.1 flagellar filament capping protein FliD [Caldimonas sp.]
MTTISSGTISSAGIGSGLDVNSIVTQLMAVERQPLTRLQTTAATYQTQLSAFGQMQSLVSSLQDAAKPLFSADSFTLSNAGSADPTSVTASTTSSAVPGIYSVAVSALSATQSLVSAAGVFADSTAVVGTGGLTISLGTWSAGQTTFTPKPGAADVTIPIGASENTLAGNRDKINAANAGISATVVTDAGGARLALQSTTPGAANGFRVTVADADAANGDAAGLSRLAYDPLGAGAQMTVAQSAANAQATINGIAVTSSSNSLAGVIDGITFNLAKVTTQPVTVNVTRNTDAIKTMVASFVAAYNQLNSFLSQATHYDATTKQAALLQGDGTTTGIQNQLHSLIGQKTGASSTFASMSALGVQVQKDGSLKLDDTAFAKAVTNLPELTKALSNVDLTNAGNNGFGKRFSVWTTGLLASNGALPGKTTAIQARITSNQKDQDAMNDRLTQTEARMRAQYSALDATMSTANALAKYVTQQFYSNNSFSGSLNSNSNNGN